MSKLNGRRILILEEQMSIALLLVDMLNVMNCTVVGPADRIPEALALLAGNDVDAAILDIKIEGEASFPVAEELLRRGIPWAFAASNSTDNVAKRYPDMPLIAKPYAAAHVQSVLERLLADGENSPADPPSA